MMANMLVSAITIALMCLCMTAGSHGNIVCEHLSKGSCAFAVSSSGKRCVLEKRQEAFSCRASEIEAAARGWIETEHCVQACGLDRNALGISSDSLLDSHFTGKLCSAPCYRNCPNVVHLYFNIAVGEGIYLPKLCELKGDGRRKMAEIRSSGFVAEGPESGEGIRTAAASPTIAPAFPPFPI